MESELHDESSSWNPASARPRARRAKAMLIVGMAALGAGIGGAGIANAATSGSSTSASSTAAASTTQPADPAKMTHGPNETLLTGTTADKVKAAALAADPGATIIRVETDSAGSPYEAHITKADGTEATVKIDANFKVTSTESGFGGGPGGGYGHGPQGAPSAGAPGTATPSA